MIKLIENMFAKKNITLNERESSLLASFGDLVIETNQVMNLTAITEKDQIVEKHFLDAYSLVPVIRGLGLEKEQLIDLGSGAGFPGIPLAIFLPEMEITLLESMEKRCVFLRKVVDTLSLTNVKVCCDRAENWGRSEKRSGYGLVTARAVSSFRVLLEYALPLLKKEGYFFAYKGAKAEEEIKEAEKALSLLGGKVIDVYPYQLLEPGERCIIATQKQSETKEKYPRRVGIPEKKPL